MVCPYIIPREEDPLRCSEYVSLDQHGTVTCLCFIGITDENRDDVKWCVHTSSLEKRIRYAARNMFHSINTAHKEVLSPDEYSDAIKKLTGGKEQKLLLAAGKTRT